MVDYFLERGLLDRLEDYYNTEPAPICEDEDCEFCQFFYKVLQCCDKVD